MFGDIGLHVLIGGTAIPVFSTNYDPPEAEAPGFWTFIEVVVGIIAANMPALAPLFRERARLGTMLAPLVWKRSRPNCQETVAELAESSATLADGDGRRKGQLSREKGDGIGAWDQYERLDRLEYSQHRNNMEEILEH